MAAPSASVAAPIASLPRDLLRLILGLLPPRGLLLASRVCKLWRAIAILLTTSLRDPKDLAGAAQVYSCVQTLIINDEKLIANMKVCELPLPALTSLSQISFPDMAHDAYQALFRRSTLRHVGLVDPWQPIWEGLIAPSAASLTSLSISLRDSSEYPFLSALHLPKLTSLSIDFSTMFIGDDICTSMCELIARASTQLESLTVFRRSSTGDAFWVTLRDVPLPCLTRLEVRDQKVTATHLLGVLVNCAADVSLTLHCSIFFALIQGDDAALDARIAAHVTEFILHDAEMCDWPKVEELLTHTTTRLISLSMQHANSDLLEGIAQTRHAASVTHIAAPAACVRHLRPFTRLTHLHLHRSVGVPTDDCDDWRDVRLPSVTRLVASEVCSPARIAALLLCLPGLRTLAARLDSESSVSEAVPLSDAHAHLSDAAYSVRPRPSASAQAQCERALRCRVRVTDRDPDQ